MQLYAYAVYNADLFVQVTNPTQYLVGDHWDDTLVEIRPALKTLSQAQSSIHGDQTHILEIDEFPLRCVHIDQAD